MSLTLITILSHKINQALRKEQWDKILPLSMERSTWIRLQEKGQLIKDKPYQREALVRIAAWDRKTQAAIQQRQADLIHSINQIQQQKQARGLYREIAQFTR